jgi:flagellar protein FlaJ
LWYYALTFIDVVHRYFNWAGRLLLRFYPNIYVDIKSSGIGLHPEIYASIGGFAFVASIFASIVISYVSIIRLPIFYIPFILAFSIFLPVLVFIIAGFILPKALSINNAAGYDQEAPYVFAYMSVMVTGGISPYTAFERLDSAEILFKRFSKAAKRFKLMVRAMGWDPLSAFDDLASRVKSMLIKDVIFGYVATVGAGGDVVDYLIKRSRDVFSGLVVKIKSAGEKMSTLLESYMAASFLLIMTLNVMYMITISIARISIPGINVYSLFFFSYLLMPFLSIMVIYLSDLVQYREPGLIWDPYIVFLSISLPIFIFLSYIAFIPYFYPVSLQPFAWLSARAVWAINSILTYLGVELVYAPAFSMSMVLFISLLPSTLYEIFVFRKYSKISSGVVKFLRDMVEVRKTGLSPERCITSLADRDYGYFTKYLREAASKIALGFPLRRVYEDLMARVKVWRANVFLFMLIDAIEVGGGTPETIENLAYFAEMSEAVERERAASIRILLVIPYLGAVILISSIMFMAVYMSTFAVGIVEYHVAVRIIVPATVLNVLFMGLMAGKVSTGVLASGFKHALLLSLLSMAVILTSPRMAMLFGAFGR